MYVHTTSNTETLQLALYERIATELSLKPEQVQRTVALLLDDATVPFIARYRKEATGNLDEEQIRRVAERHKYYQELEQRRATILATLTEQGKLSDALREQILACFNKVELEDLYLPYRPKRQTKASVAIERGLEPLARFLWEQQPGDQSIPELAARFVDPEKGVAHVEEALTGAGHIIAEWIAERADVRQVLRSLMFAEGKVRSTVAQGKQEAVQSRSVRRPLSRICSSIVRMPTSVYSSRRCRLRCAEPSKNGPTPKRSPSFRGTCGVSSWPHHSARTACSVLIRVCVRAVS